MAVETNETDKTKFEEPKKPKPEKPKMENPLRNKLIAWGFGILLVLAIVLGVIFPAIPVLGVVAKFLLGLFALSSVPVGLGIALGFLAPFLLPRLLFSFTGIGKTAEIAQSVVGTLIKAALYAGIAFALGYFMPVIMGFLVAKVAALSFLSFMAGGAGGVLSVVMTSLSAAGIFFKTMYQGGFVSDVKEKPGRALEVFLGTLLMVGAGALIGVAHFVTLPFTLPLVFSIAAIVVGCFLALGLPSTLGEWLKSGKSPVEEGMDHGPGPLPVPKAQEFNAPKKPEPNGPEVTPGQPSHPADVANSRAADGLSADSSHVAEVDKP